MQHFQDSLKNPLGQTSSITQMQRDTMHQKIRWICIFHIICRIHCKWRNIKTLRARTAIFLYRKTCRSSWDNRIVQNQPPGPMYVCVQSSTLLFTKFLAKADRQNWLEAAYHISNKKFVLSCSQYRVITETIFMICKWPTNYQIPLYCTCSAH